MPLGQLGGVPASWHVFGTGPRRGLALHCALAHGAAWHPLFGALDDVFTAHALDLPGHGKAQDWDAGSPYLDQAMPLIEALAGTGPGPIDVFGHSFGGVLALAFAVKHPDRVRSLTLFEPVFFAAIAGTEAAQQNHRDFAPFDAAIEAGDDEAATRAFTAVWGGATSWDDLPAWQRHSMIERIHLIPAGQSILYDDAADILGQGRLEALTAPVHLMCGANSPPVVPAILNALAARLPQAKTTVLPGAGHMAPITRAAQMARAVTAFFSSL